MRVNKLTKKIILQEPNTVSDGQGGSKKTGSGWKEGITVWAEFREPNVRELAMTGTVTSELIRQISIHHRSDVRRGWQVAYGNRIFKVQHTFDYDMSTTILVCQEVVK